MGCHPGDELQVVHPLHLFGLFTIPVDSLAEAYAAKGEKALAIKNYAKSLELDPDNTNAVEKLNQLIKEK
jgi:hypothetical protein